MVGKTLGPYKIIELLGAGGMGKVYRPDHPPANSDFARGFLDLDRMQQVARGKWADEGDP